MPAGDPALAVGVAAWRVALQREHAVAVHAGVTPAARASSVVKRPLRPWRAGWMRKLHASPALPCGLNAAGAASCVHCVDCTARLRALSTFSCRSVCPGCRAAQRSAPAPCHPLPRHWPGCGTGRWQGTSKRWTLKSALSATSSTTSGACVPAVVRESVARRWPLNRSGMSKKHQVPSGEVMHHVGLRASSTCWRRRPSGAISYTSSLPEPGT